MGQINDDTLFGKIITRIASDEKYSTICEIGTWNGQGSTQCVMQGLNARKQPFTFFSLEADKQFYDKAVEFWTPCPSSLVLMYGSLHNKIMSKDEIRMSPHFQTINPEYENWYKGELKNIMQCPRITLPVSNVDVVILDGGEFTTEEDWNILKTYNPKVVVLDDTRAIKTSNIRKELIESPEWETLFDVQYERNGWAVFRRHEQLPPKDAQEVHP